MMESLVSSKDVADDVALALVDDRGTVLFADVCFGALMDEEPASLVDRRIEDILPEAAELLLGESRSHEQWEFPQGHREIKARRLKIPGGHFLLLIRDVTPATRQWEESRRFQAVLEEERTEIAREVHDELGQVLIGLKMQIASWAKEDQGGLAGKHSRGILTAVDRTISEVRRITTRLRPLVLDDLGLVAAVEWQKQEFQERTGIRCSFTRPIEFDLEPEKATAMFRILQEALTNAARHAQASHISIVLKQIEGFAVMTIRDNGRGISNAASREAWGLGLSGMRRRAGAWSGEVIFSGIEGKGTMITVRIPFREGSR